MRVSGECTCALLRKFLLCQKHGIKFSLKTQLPTDEESNFKLGFTMLLSQLTRVQGGAWSHRWHSEGRRGASGHCGVSKGCPLWPHCHFWGSEVRARRQSRGKALEGREEPVPGSGSWSCRTPSSGLWGTVRRGRAAAAPQTPGVSGQATSSAQVRAASRTHLPGKRGHLLETTCASGCCLCCCFHTVPLPSWVFIRHNFFSKPDGCW